ncbi:hypothetical protein FOZ63_016695, partial [Perkinsus olseni]
MVINAPPTFTFSDPCHVILATEDESIVFTEGTDFECSVATDGDGNQQLTVELIGTKSVLEAITYELTFYVVNPLVPPDTVEPWLLKSYDIEGNALDEVPIPGYEVVASMKRFEVMNPSNIVKGAFKVPNVVFKSIFPEPLMDGDLI